jgi:transposase
MSLNMSATSVPSRLGSLFNRSGNGHPSSHGLSVRSEEPEATTSERTIGTAAGGAKPAAAEPLVAPTEITRATRRRYTKEEKLRILRLADAARQHGQVGALLRREGIYYSTLRDFQKQRANGCLEPGGQQVKRTASIEASEDKARIAELEAQVRQLTQRLLHAEIVIDVQKKLSELLGIPLPQTEPSHRAQS